MNQKIGVILSLCSLVVGCVAPAGGADVGANAEALSREERRGRSLFQHETFGGNGRACETCHRLDNNGTIDPEFIAGLDPSDPLFRPIDSDDGTGATYDQLRARATVNVTLRLPPYLRPCNDLSATTWTVRRSVPTSANVAAESVFNWDASATSLDDQALGAVFAHFEPTRTPTSDELLAIAAFQETLFTRREVRKLARRGRVPELPRGNTPAQRRGRDFYLPEGQCGVCHSGPMLNELSAFHPDVVAGGRSAGERTAMILAGTVGNRPQPGVQWCVLNPAGAVVLRTPVPFADPGIAVNTFPNRPGVIGGFKIPTLWGAAGTAPFFHDASALDLQQMMDHYNLFFARFSQFGPQLTRAEQADAIAYLELLGVRGNRNDDDDDDDDDD